MGCAASTPSALQLYRPRAAEHTVLYRIVRTHLATFLRAASAHDDRGLPAFVEQEFRDFLTCVTFVHTELLRILEEVLPARFGGSSTDYQLVEEVRDGGLNQLVLIVSPHVGAVDEGMARDTFLDELGRDGWSERLMAGMWERAGTVIVRRQEPVATRAGEILPFHVTGRAAPERPTYSPAVDTLQRC